MRNSMRVSKRQRFFGVPALRQSKRAWDRSGCAVWKLLVLSQVLLLSPGAVRAQGFDPGANSTVVAFGLTHLARCLTKSNFSIISQPCGEQCGEQSDATPLRVCFEVPNVSTQTKFLLGSDGKSLRMLRMLASAVFNSGNKQLPSSECPE
jgi:hypothetical protein